MASVKYYLLFILTMSLLKSVQLCEHDSNWFLFENYCYRILTDSKEWRAAQWFCKSVNAELASLHSSRESEFIMDLKKNNPSNTTDKVWIGLHALRTFKQFEWSDGSSMDYRNWDIGEPNNNKEKDDCGQMTSTTGLWSDASCSNKMAFVCKKLKSRATKTTVAASSPKIHSPRRHPPGRLGTGAIVGIAVGCLVLGIILIAACVYLRPWTTSNVLFHPI